MLRVLANVAQRQRRPITEYFTKGWAESVTSTLISRGISQQSPSRMREAKTPLVDVQTLNLANNHSLIRARSSHRFSADV